MLARTPWRLMTDALITPDMAEAAALRHWGKHDANRLALAITRGIYGELDARRELAATLAWHAEQAKIRTVSCRALALEMLDEAVAAIENHNDAVLRRMTGTAEKMLRDGVPFRDTAHFIADIARKNQALPDYIQIAMARAEWRVANREASNGR